MPHLGFLQILLGDEPALAPYQQIYRRLIRKAVADASTVALAEIEEKGRERGLDDGMGRMVVLAEADRAQDRLSAAQVEAIVEGTDEVLDFLAADAIEARPAAAGRRRLGGPRAPGLSSVAWAAGDRSTMPRPRSSPSPCASRVSRPAASAAARSRPPSDKTAALAIHLICYASHPSDAVRRYTLRKLTLGGGARQARHLVIDYDVAPARCAVDRRRGGAWRTPSPAISPRCAGWPRSMP